MKRHLLKECQNITEELKKKIGCDSDEYNAHKANKSKSASPSLTPASSFSEVNRLEGPKRRTGEQVDFESDVCEWFVACAIPWNAANNPQTHLFSTKWFPKNVFIPDRRILSGRILDAHVKKVEDRVEVKVKGKFATGQCDGWKNVAKTNVITTVMTVENEVRFKMPFDAQINIKFTDFYSHISSKRMI